jgi:hypothetical protein
MPSTYSPLKIELPATGEQSGTWGNTTNTNLGTALEEAITGSANVTFASGNVTLTLTDTNASQVARNLRLNLIGVTGGSTRTLTVPAIKKLYLVSNNCADSVIVGNSTGATVTVPAGNNIFIYNDGTDVLNAITYITALNAATVAAGSVTTTQVDIVSQGDLRLQDTTGGQFVALQAPGTVASSYTLTLPVDDGTDGQALITDGNGVLSWSTAASGDVYGPASATDNAIARFDLTTGKIIQNSVVTIADSTGNMAGVGTLSSGAITTTGVLTVPAGTNSAPAITTTGDTNTGMYFPAADTIAFTEGGVESMRIDSSGNVGIGVTPTAKLDVNGLVQIRGSGGEGGEIQLLNAANNAVATAIDVDASNNLRINNGLATSTSFLTNSVVRLAIASNGFVTTSNIVGINGGATASDYALSITGSSGINGGLVVFDSTSAFSTILLQNTTAGYLGTRGSYPLVFQTNNTERMRITSAGQVGIGTSSPLANRLQIINATSIGASPPAAGTYGGPVIIGNDSTAYGLYVGVINSGDGYLQAQRGDTATTYNLLLQPNGGNVGIGITSPSVNLSLKGVGLTTGTANILRLFDDSGAVTSTTSNSYGFGHNNATGQFSYTAGTGGFHAWFTANTERMRIDSSGNVGIGVTPSAWGGNFAGLQTKGGFISSQSTLYLYSGQNAYYNGTNWIYTTSAESSIYEQTSGVHIWYSAASGTAGNAITFSERMRIDSSGNVGIGTTDTSGIKLNVNAGSASLNTNFNSTNASGVYVRFQNSSTSIGDIGAGGSVISGGTAGDFAMASRSGNLVLGTGSAERMRIDSNGNVGIGVTPSAWSISNGEALQISNTVAIWNFANTNAYFSNNLYFNGTNRIFLTNGWATEYSQAAGTHVWSNSTASGTAGGTATMDESMRLSTDGNLFLGGTSNPYFLSKGIGLNKNGTVQMGVNAGQFDILGIYRNGSTGIAVSFWYNSSTSGSASTGSLVGNIATTASATSYVTSSDYRLKENIEPMTGALATVQALNPVTYKWKVDGSDGQGFIAHELQEVVPECVTGEKDAVNDDGSIKAQGIDTSFLVATLTAAIQELKATVDAQAARIAALESK